MKDKLTYKGHDGPVYVCTFNKDGQYVLSGGNDKSIQLWNPHKKSPLDEGQPLQIKTYKGPHGYAVTGIAIANDNARFASCGKEKTVFIWDVTTAATTRRISGHDERVNSVIFNQEGTVLASGSYDKTVKLWDLRSIDKNPIQTLSDFKDSVTSVKLTEDSIIASCVDGMVRTYDLRMGKMFADNVFESITSLGISHDENCLLLSCTDNICRLLERGTGEILASYKGHKSTNYSIGCCFSYDDAEVLSGSEDGKIYKWDLVESKVTGIYTGHTRTVCDISFHPTSNIFVSSSFDGNCKVWA